MIGRRGFLAASTTLLLAACDRQPASNSGDAGALRVVSLSPSTTEAMFAIGAGSMLVGRSEHCDHPDKAKALPSVGGFATPNMEAIIAMRPTLVIGSQGPSGPELERKLKGHGVATYFPETSSIAQITAMIRGLGERLGRVPTATRVAGDVDHRVKELRAWTTKRATVGVVMVFDVSPVYVAGPGSFPDELIRLAGGKNLITRGGKWPTIDVEHLVHLDPAVIVDAMGVGHGAASRVGKAPGWEKLTAVKTGNVRALRSSAALRPGPRIGGGLADVAQAIHGMAPK